MKSSYVDRLDEAVARCGNPCLLGLDPHLDLLPEEYAAARAAHEPRSARAGAIADFCCELVDLAAGAVAAVKPQSAFFELFGADGAFAWERVIAHARARGLLVVGDVKRGDIASTASAYAQALLDPPAGLDRAAVCDAITVNPLLGRDSLEPFVAVAEQTGAGLYALVRTSNPGGGEFQLHGEPHLSARIAGVVDELGQRLRGQCGLSSLGAVVGATHATELERFRALLPRTPFLLPGYGAQGARAADLKPAFLAGGRGALVASSRAVAFAWRAPEHAGHGWRDASRRALDAMIADLQRNALHSGSSA